MTLLWKRQVQLEIADYRIENLRIDFQIDRQIAEPVTGEIKIYNLSRRTEDRIVDRGSMARLRAGYRDTIATIFEGGVTRVTRRRETTERVTVAELGGVVPAIRINGMTNRSYVNPTVRQIVTDIITEDLRMDVGDISAIPESARTDTWQWSGPAWGALVSICRSVNTWPFEDDGVIRVNSLGRPQSDAVDIRLSQATGMIGAPGQTDEGAKVRMFLNPLARIGGIVTLESEYVRGNWKISGVRHKGTNWEGLFETELELRAIRAPRPAQ